MNWITKPDQMTTNEQSLEVPSDLEDVVNEIVSELDHSPIETHCSGKVVKSNDQFTDMYTPLGL